MRSLNNQDQPAKDADNSLVVDSVIKVNSDHDTKKLKAVSSDVGSKSKDSPEKSPNPITSKSLVQETPNKKSIEKMKQLTIKPEKAAGLFGSHKAESIGWDDIGFVQL